MAGWAGGGWQNFRIVDTPDSDKSSKPGTVIIGAGPAGLTAAYELTKHGHPAQVFEADDVVGGISRRPPSATAGASTSAATGSSPRSKQVDELWHEILPTRTSCSGRG